MHGLARWPPGEFVHLVAFEARNSPLLTIEGMAQGEILHPIQEALIACSGFQCGFWPPNMILATTALLDENPHPTVGEITLYMRDNLCRCTGYKCIPKAVRRAAQRLASLTRVYRVPRH